MPTYQIQAPNGQTYQIPGPDGATQEDIQAEVMRQHPEAAQPAMSAPTAEILRDRPESTWAATPQRPAEVGEIRAEPTFFEGVGQGLKSVSKDVLPLAGMTAGGALGLPLGGPVGAAAGGIGGYALGKQANDTIEALFNYLSGQPVRPASEIPGRFAGQVGEGATIEAGGAVLGKAGNVLSDILRSAGVMGVPAARAPLIAAAERAGVELPASAATGSRALAAVEATPGRFPIGAQQGREFYDRVGMSMQRTGERLAQSAGPDVGLEAAGRGIQRDVAGVAGSQEQAARELIDQYVGQFGGGRELAPGALGSQPDEPRRRSPGRARCRADRGPGQDRASLPGRPRGSSLVRLGGANDRDEGCGRPHPRARGAHERAGTARGEPTRGRHSRSGQRSHPRGGGRLACHRAGEHHPPARAGPGARD
jgi:hypothetical protein